MKVLHVITGLTAGGAESQLRLLCRHLAADCEVVVLAGEGLLAAGFRADGVRVIGLGMGGNRDLRAVGQLVALMRAGRYDCVHTHLFRAGLYGRLAARVAGVPKVLATEHSLGEALIEGRRTDRPGLRALYLAGERLGDRTIAVSGTTAQRMIAWGVPAEKVTVVPNGVDARSLAFRPERRTTTRATLGLAEDAFVVGGVGRLVPTKRFDLVLDAVAAVPGVHLLLVGDGPEAPALRARATEFGIGDRVHLPGATDDVSGALAAMDLFVSPCPEETYGLAVLEALAAGLPVRYVSCPALEELGPHAAPQARRVAPDVAALARAIRETAQQPRRPEDRAPPPAVAHYDIRLVAARVDALYGDPRPDARSTGQEMLPVQTRTPLVPDTRTPPVWHVEVLREDDALDTLRRPLQALYRRSAHATAFQAPAWLAAWWAEYGRRGRLRLVVVRRDGELVAAAPLMATRWLFWRVLRPLGGNVSDYSDVLVDDRYADGARPTLARAVAGIRGAHLVDLPEVRTPSAASGLVEHWPGRVHRTPASVCLVLPATPLADHVRAMPKKSAKSRRKDMYSVTAAGLVARAVETHEVAAGVRRLLELHRRQWEGRPMTTEHGHPRFRRFLTAAAADLARDGDAEVMEHRRAGEVVACELLLAGPGLIGGYLFGHEPELRKEVNVAAMLLDADLQRAIERGYPEFSMLRGAEPYKERWHPRAEPSARLLFAVGRGPGARTVLPAVRAFEAGKDLVRQQPRLRQAVEALRDGLRRARRGTVRR